MDDQLASANAVVISQTFSKLLQNIPNGKESEALINILKEKCIGFDHSTGVVACNTILELIERGDLQAESFLNDLITIITTTNCAPNVVFLLNNLLLKQISINGDEAKIKCPYNLQFPQHPFIILLNKDAHSWQVIFKEIEFSYRNEKNHLLHCNTLYKPLFLYALCPPQWNTHLMLRQKLWTFILNIEDNSPILNYLLSWMHFESRNLVELNSDLLVELSEINQSADILNHDLLLLFQTSCLFELITHNFDPRSTIYSIQDTLSCNNDLKLFDPVALILAKTITKCSSAYLTSLLQICKSVIHSGKCSPLILQAFKLPLLHWIANNSLLTSDATKLAHALFKTITHQSKITKRRKDVNAKFLNQFSSIITTNTHCYISLKIAALCEALNTTNDLKSFISTLENVPDSFLVQIADLLFCLQLSPLGAPAGLHLKIFRLIVRAATSDMPKISPLVITLMLYKLSLRDCDSEYQFALLRAMPQMAANKENFQKVVGTLQALNTGPSVLKTFSTGLMFDLWRVDIKCYHFLEKLLIKPFDGKSDKWEFYITRAGILKELCALKPELYGKDMVAHLSRILNECSDVDGVLACALAIDGIALLCKFEIIDAVTTWATLAPMLENDARTSVVKSMCYLIYEIPNLGYTEAFPDLIVEVLNKLWHYISLNPSKSVWDAALNALTAFSLEQIVAQMPDDYMSEETIAIRKAGQIVPAQCWIQFLRNCNQAMLGLASNFLIKMVTLEISRYLKFVYQVKGAREPGDYSYLPANSVVRGVASFLKSKVLKWRTSLYKEVYLECLRVFSQEYSKPLPPLDWCFLQELVHEPEARNMCISIAAHQVMLSGTARRFIVNFLESVTENPNNESDMLIIYKNLKHLGNSVQPMTLKPFFHATIDKAIDSFTKDESKLLLSILENIKETLRDEAIQEANKTVVAQILSEILTQNDINSKLFELILDCVPLFPKHCINALSSGKSVKGITSEWLKKAIKIRCFIAFNATASPLNWLNELMDNTWNLPESIPFLFNELTLVFKAHKHTTDCALWVLDLIGQIQALIADKSDKKQILFLCDVFILATIVFSGHFIFLGDLNDRNQMQAIFPRAIASLLDDNHWSVCANQALEWFWHVTTLDVFPESHKKMFVQCLKCLRHEQEFTKNQRWLKYLNVELTV